MAYPELTTGIINREDANNPYLKDIPPLTVATVQVGDYYYSVNDTFIELVADTAYWGAYDTIQEETDIDEDVCEDSVYEEMYGSLEHYAFQELRIAFPTLGEEECDSLACEIREVYLNLS